MKKPLSEWLIDKFDNLIEQKIRDNREKFSHLRTIFLNNVRPSFYYGDEPLAYSSNNIVTSKYTLLNFLPKNLFEQFRRIANFYFLVNIIILFIIPDPPTNPYANALPLIIVIAITAIKQAYEDIIRHRADYEVNSRTVRVLRPDGSYETIKCQDIRCGDLIEVNMDETFPCDLILAYANTENGTCFIKTSNLDGETNLKMRSVPHKFPSFAHEQDLANLNGLVVCDKPNTKLYEFKGKLVLDHQEIPISNENILLRGTNLKIAPFILGYAVYTGRDTKMMLNSKFKSNKLSCVEKKLNYFVGSFIVVLLTLSIICLVGSILYDGIYKDHWYLSGKEPQNYKENRALYYFIMFMYFVNLNYLIPLSLYVTLELIRFFGSRFFEWDLKMYDEKSDQPAKVNSSDLNEDLGQIEYLFSDKTGTLTQNDMIFKRFSIDGRVFEEFRGEIVEIDNSSYHPIEENKLNLFLEALSVCHSVQIDQTTDEKYNGSSPDELCFVKFCSKLGIVFEGDEIEHSNNATSVRNVVYKSGSRFNRSDNDRHNRYELLHTLEFDSERKRMSVLVRDRQREGECLLVCKGADSAIFPVCTCRQERFYENTLREFSESGWRVLVVAYRVLSSAECARVSRMLDEAANDVLNREKRLAQVYREIETGLTVVGVTAVEDKLQEDVESTLSALREAGIKIWVLTGDKLETAINISDSCRHFSPDMVKFVLKELKNPQEIQENLEIVQENNLVFALVIDGETLSTILEAGPDYSKKFRDVSMKCHSVLCCRMSPSQKALIVKLVKSSREKPMTAAIGDGANDVSMIQEAHVGFGIFGKEGRQAAISSDFCFAKFKFLKRALLVHGYLYYTRASILVLYFFYKNLMFAICQFYFCFWNAFSSTSLYSSLYISFYNLAFTPFPPIAFALFDQHQSIHKLDKNPLYYKTITKNKYLSTSEFLKWIFITFWQSATAFFLSIGLLHNHEHIYNNGKISSFRQLGSLVLILLLIFVHVKIVLIWNHKNMALLLSILGDILGFVIVCLPLNAVIVPWPLTFLTDEQSLYFVFFVLFSSWKVWFAIFLSVVLAMTPDILIRVIENLKREQRFNELTRENSKASFSQFEPAYFLETRREITRSLSSAEMSDVVTTVENTDLYSHNNNSPIFLRGKPNSKSNNSISLNTLTVDFGYGLRASDRSLSKKSNQISPVVRF